MNDLILRDTPTTATVLADHLASLSPNTRRAYGQDLRAFASWSGRLQSEQEVAAWFVSMEAGAANAAVVGFRRSLQEQGLSTATISRRLTGIRTLVTILRASGLLSYALEVKGPKATGPTRDVRGPRLGPWNAALNRAWTRPRLYAAMLLLHDLGLRRQEALDLDLEHVHLEAGEVMVSQKGHGTTRHPRKLPLRTLQALVRWIDIRGPEPGPLFTTVSGRRWKAGKLYDSIRELDGDLSCHKIRHRAATEVAKRSDGDVMMVQAFLGHTDPRTSMRYVDDAFSRADAASELVAS